MENYQNQNDPNYRQPQTNGNENFMVTKLPNTTIAMVLGIVSIVCCCTGIIGIICSVIGLVIINKDIKLYNNNPQQYTGIQNANTARILNIIGLVLSIFNILYSIYQIMTIGGWDAYMNEINEAIRTVQEQQQ
ncbi:MAG TPA: CCC motif membrane protein [Flavobacterium sp.]|nr:CCC motif membrane protein [Flavobacterium sp.]